jgi:lipid-A-disaccharide synthase
MRALVRLVPDVRFRGVGGESMEAVIADSEQFKSLFNIAEISVMGIFEVLPRLPLIMRRIRQTISDIEDFHPDILVTVDSWGFVSALLTRLRKKWRRENTGQVPVIHYVAPQVWAWKKGRAKSVARLVDRLMTLLPNEGRHFEKYGLLSDFVGHPVVERITQAQQKLDPDAFRATLGIPADATVVSVLPGSRHSEVKRLIPILKEAIEQLADDPSIQPSNASSTKLPTLPPSQLFVVVPTVAGVEQEVRHGFEGFPLPVRVVTGESARYNAFAISNLALAKSGTVSLELVAMGVPHLIAYTFGPLSNLVARMLVKVRFANLINILSDSEIIPEFVLGNCRPEPIAACARKLLPTSSTATTTSNAAKKQIEQARNILSTLRLPDTLPSDRAAQIVAETAQKARTQKQNNHIN